MASCLRIILPAVLALGLLAPWGARASGLPEGIELVEDGPDRIVLHVSVPQPVWRDELPGGLFPSLPGYGLLLKAGRPVLPRVVLRLAVPDGVPLRLETEVLEATTLPGRIIAAPHVERQADARDPAGPGRVILRAAAPDPGLAGPFPRSIATLEGRARLRDLPVARIGLTPIRVADRSGRIEMARRFRVVLSWDRRAAARVAAPGAARRGAFESVYRLGVANPGGVTRHRIAPGGRPAGPGQSAVPTAGTASTSRDATSALVPPGGAVAATAGAPVLRPALTLTPLAGSTVYRVELSQDGIYRLDQAWLGAFAPDILLHPTGAVFLQGNGVEIPIRVVDGGDGVWSSGDYLEFWGESVDEDPLDPDAWEGGDFTDTRPYYLGVASGPRLRMSTSVSGAPVGGLAVLTSFTASVRVENDTSFLNSVPSDDAERWYDTFLVASTPFADYPVTLPGLIGTGSASLEVRLLGDTVSGNPQGLHRTRLLVNGIVEDQADWDGLRVYTHGVDDGPVSFPASDLAPSSTLRVDLPLDRQQGGTTFTEDLVWVDWLLLRYPRDFTAAADRLFFEVPNQAGRIVVTGLTSSDAAVYDLTPAAGGLAAPLHLAGAVVSGSGPYTVTFELDPADVAGTTRRLVVSAGAGLAPDAVSVHGPGSDLSTGGADWLLIGNDTLLDLSPTSSLADLVALRQSQGLATRVVGLRDVYDQFAYGLADPQAIRDLIHWALVNWSPAPTFAVLVGDGTFDYKNAFGHPVPRNLLPTYMGSQVISPQLTYFSEDNKFAAVLGGDDLADVLLGRLPTHTLAETEATFAKIVAYEATTPGPPWTRRAFFVSDAEGGGFESTMRFVIDSYFDRPENPGFLDAMGACFSTGTCRNNQMGAGPIFQTASFQTLINRNFPLPPSASTMTQWIRDGLDAGSSIMMFIGHGGFQNWGLEATIFRSRSFTLDDIDTLNNASTPTFMINLNCISGGFHTDSRPGAAIDQLYALGEDFLVTPDRGGVGVLAPSHLTFISVLAPASNSVWDALLGEGPRERLFGGISLVLRLKFDELGADTEVRSFTFLGDPATRLVLPDPAPPALSATAGNGFVDLSWTSGDGSTFRLERTGVGPDGPYTAITPPGHASTLFTDTTVNNGTTYWYRVIARDADGMDSIPSNRNQDCPSGPDCAQATPLNPLPPATPTGFAAVDAGTGGTIQLSWDANPEPDIDFYRARYGPSAGVYPFEAKFNGGSSGEIGELTDEEPVFFILEAVNTSGLSSPATGPLTATPHLVLGIAPPRPVTDLFVWRDAADIMLSWSRVDLDIYGRPAAVSEYRIFSSVVSPLFSLEEANRIASVPDAPAPSYRHVGAAAGPETRFYLVLTRDADGFDSTSGLALPASVLDLQVVRLGGGLLRLSWSPVTIDRQGNPLAIDHYTVHGSPQPFSRADTELMTPLASFVTATTVDLPEGAEAYFSVLAVDNRGNVSPF